MTDPQNRGDEHAPADINRAAAWLRAGHPWLDELLTRVVGPAEPDDLYARWLDVLVEGFNDLTEDRRAWEEYARTHPEPSQEGRWQTWHDAGPKLRTPAGRALAPMSGGEIRVLRLMTTLAVGARVQVGWRLDDIDFDARGAAIVEDWISVVRAQHCALMADPVGT
jgi:hypothetical protein